MQHRDIAVAGALGAGIGTVLAIVFRSHVVLGALGGAFAGALIGGLSFRPREVARVVWQTLRERWREIALSTAWFVMIGCTVTAFRHWPHQMFSIAAAALGGILAINGWRHRAAVARIPLWLFGKALAVVHVLGTFLIGATALPFLIMVLTRNAMGMRGAADVFFFGFALTLVSMFLVVCVVNPFIAGGLFMSLPERWSWACSRRIYHFFQLERTAMGSEGGGPLIREEDGMVRIGGRLFRPREFRTLLAETGSIAVVTATLPLIIASMFLGVILDIPITIALALASSKRIAVMEGAFLGATLGAAAFRAGVLPPVAVILAMAVGAASGVGLYRLRKWLERPAPAAA
ncbi:MAG: hypothetical protein Q7S02_02570 [bacterium]|nr:hypothetical protein [bacterium]